MGVSSPRFKSPSRQLRSSRLRGQSLNYFPEQDHSNAESSQAASRSRSKGVAVLGVCCMIVFCPPLIIYLWFAHTHLGGSLLSLRTFIRNGHGLQHIRDIWPKPNLNTFKIISFFTLFQAALLALLPGERQVGPITPNGNHPVYKSNGFAAYCTTMLTAYVLWREGIFNPASLHDHLGHILSAQIGMSMILSIMLYIKGLKWPSSTDCGSCGHFMLDLFWGFELHPRLGSSFDIKTFVNSRLGMMSWALLIMSYMCKQFQSNDGHISNSLLVTGSLMLLYISKHFWLERGYFNSVDVAHERVGLYSLWSSLVWIPAVHASPALFLESHPVQLGRKVAAAIFLFGLISIGLLFECDYQKILTRETKGKCEIWGQPITKINAHYITRTGERHTNLLLASGWWGKARHFHYLPEIAVAFLWTLPCLQSHFLPYLYVLSLICFLVDRAKRDDLRCKKKYHKYWEAYCKKVPWKIIPRVF